MSGLLCFIGALAATGSGCVDSVFCKENVAQGETQYHVKCRQWQKRCPCICKAFDMHKATEQMERNRSDLQKKGVLRARGNNPFGKREGAKIRLADAAAKTKKTKQRFSKTAPPTPRPTPHPTSKRPPATRSGRGPKRRKPPARPPPVPRTDRCFSSNALEFPKITNVLYINLDESISRKAHMEKVLTEMGLPHQRVPAVRPKDRMGSHLKLGEVGVWLGHQAAWRAVLNSEHKYTMIMEDDVDLEPNTGDQYGKWSCAVPKNSDMIFLHTKIRAMRSSTILGHSKLKECGKYDVAERYTWGYSMLAYVVTQQGAQKLLDRTKDGKFRIPVDGYPFNKGLNKGLEVFVNMNLYAYTHDSLNDQSDKDAVTHHNRLRRLLSWAENDDRRAIVPDEAKKWEEYAWLRPPTPTPTNTDTGALKHNAAHMMQAQPKW